jgi:hypothetical protein
MTGKQKRHFQNWVLAFSEYTRDTEAPAHFHIWCAIYGIASMLKRNVYIPQLAFDWAPNNYIILVGDPGVVTKSTSIRIVEKLLRETGKVNFGSNSSTWQTLVNELANARIANEVTGLISSPLSLIVSELGSFLDMENREQIDFMVDIWDAQKGLWLRNTVGTGQKKIESPCLNMIAATTPQWIKNNFKQTMVGGGFASRLIMVLGKKKRKLIAYPGYDGTGLRKEMEDKLIEDLLMIGEMAGEMHLTEEAKEWGREWYNTHITDPKTHRLQGDKFQGYYARKQTHMHKIAMIMSAACGDSMMITAKQLQCAHGMLLEMEVDYGEVMDYAQAGGYYSQAKVDVLRRIREGASDREKLYAEMSTIISGSDFERMIGDLAKANLITQRVIPGGKIVLTPRSADVVPITKTS